MKYSKKILYLCPSTGIKKCKIFPKRNPNLIFNMYSMHVKEFDLWIYSWYCWFISNLSKCSIFINDLNILFIIQHLRPLKGHGQWHLLLCFYFFDSYPTILFLSTSTDLQVKPKINSSSKEATYKNLHKFQ